MTDPLVLLVDHVPNLTYARVYPVALVAKIFSAPVLLDVLA